MMGGRGATSGQPDRYQQMADAMTNDLRGLSEEDRTRIAHPLGWGTVTFSEGRRPGTYVVEAHAPNYTGRSRSGLGKRLVRRSNVTYEDAVGLAVGAIVDHARAVAGD